MMETNGAGDNETASETASERLRPRSITFLLLTNRRLDDDMDVVVGKFFREVC